MTLAAACLLSGTVQIERAQADSATVEFDLFGPGIDGESLSSLSLTYARIRLDITAQNTILTIPRNVVPALITGNIDGGGLGVDSGVTDPNAGLVSTQTDATGFDDEELVISISSPTITGPSIRLDSVTLTHANYSDSNGNLDPLRGEQVQQGINDVLAISNISLDPSPIRSGTPGDLSEITVLSSFIFGAADNLILGANGISNVGDGFRVKRLTFTLEVSVIPVLIDIKPNDDQSRINLCARGPIPVAILSSETFDAPMEVDPATVSLAGAGVLTIGADDRPWTQFRDVNGDGLADLIVKIVREGLGLGSGDTEAELTGHPCRYAFS